VAERDQVVVHDVEVAGLVEGLAGRRQLGLERHQPIGELRRDLPRRQLAPHDDREDALEGAALVVRDPDTAVAGEQLAEHVAAVPRHLLAAVVDPRALAEAAGLTGGALEVEHVVAQRAASVAGNRHGPSGGAP
jgi:hypothetical protein